MPGIDPLEFQIGFHNKAYQKFLVKVVPNSLLQ